MYKLLWSIVKKKYILLIILFVISSFILLLVPQQETISRSLSLFSFFSSDFFASLWYYSKLSFDVMSLLGQLVFIGTAFMLSLNIVLLASYIKVYRSLLSSGTTGLSTLGLIAAIFTTGCLSCSILIIAPIVSIFGVSTAIWFTNNTIYIALFAFVSIVFSSYLLLKKLSDPKVCDVVYE